MDAILFATFIPSLENLSIAKEYLENIKNNFYDCDVYVGINYGTIPERKILLEEYSNYFNLQYAFVNKVMNVDSDASAFQLALSLLNKSKKAYRLVWFIHTKGVTKNREYIRNILFHDFLNQRDSISRRILSQNFYGSYGKYITISIDLGYNDKKLEKICTFPYKSTNTFFLYTFYVIRGCIIKDFLEGVKPIFFTKNLISGLGYNRYFFESTFPAISDKFGYRPLYDKVINHPYWHIINISMVEQIIKNRNKNALIYKMIFLKIIIGKCIHGIIANILQILPKKKYLAIIILTKKIFARFNIIQKDF